MKINQQVAIPNLLKLSICFLGFSIFAIQKLHYNRVNKAIHPIQSNVRFISTSKKLKADSVTADKLGRDRLGNVLPVTTTTLDLVESYSSEWVYTGEVVPSRTSEIGFERSGKIVRVLVDEGTRISVGTPLAKLDTANLEAQLQGLVAQKNEAIALLTELNNGATQEEINSATAQVKDLERQLDLEKIRTKRREYLYSQGAINREELEEISFNSQALAERLAKAQSNLRQLQNGSRIERINAQQAVVARLTAEIKDLDITIANSILRSPFDGMVSARNLDEGSVVSPGQAVLRLVENDRLKVKVGVPIEVANRLKLGDTKIVAIGKNTYEAKIVAILPEVNAATRSTSIVLKLISPNIQQVLPGQIARLELTQQSEGNGYWLPVTALVKGDKGLWSCYALDKTQADLTVERRLVELIETQNERVFVRGTLQPGDEIVTEGTHRLVPGQIVKVKNRV